MWLNLHKIKLLSGPDKALAAIHMLLEYLHWQYKYRIEVARGVHGGG